MRKANEKKRVAESDKTYWIEELWITQNTKEISFFEEQISKLSTTPYIYIYIANRIKETNHKDKLHSSYQKKISFHNSQVKLKDISISHHI